MQDVRFLIADDNADARYLLTKTLMRKFPKCLVQECQDSDVAVAVAARHEASLIIVHRLWDVDGAALIRRLREVNQLVPIIAVSGVDRAEQAIAAGATRFLHYDQWLRIGTVSAELLGLPGTTYAPFDNATLV